MNSVDFRLVIVVSALFAFVSFGCGGSSKEEPAQAEVSHPAKLLTVGSLLGGKERRMSGEVRAAKRAKLAFQVSGLLAELPVKAGQRVEEGQLIARLDPKDYEAKLRNALGQLAKAQAQLEYDTVEYTRYVKIKKAEPGAVSDSMVNLRAAAKKVSLARLESAKAAVAAARDQLGYTHLYAPFSGIIGERYVDNFEYVTAKQPIVQLQDFSVIEVLLDLPELMAAPIRKTKPKLYAEFTAAPKRRFPLKLKEFATQADPYTQTYRLVLTTEAPEGVRILPGMTATVVIDFSQAAAKTSEIVVPAEAVFADEEGHSCVWIVDPKTNQVHRQKVTTAELTGSDNVRITDGLSDGQVIVVSGVTMVREGMTVRPYETPGLETASTGK